MRKKPLLYSAAGLVAVPLLFAGGNYLYSTQTNTVTPQPTPEVKTGSLLLGSDNTSTTLNVTNARAGDTQTFQLMLTNAGSIPITKFDMKLDSSGELANNPVPQRSWEEVDPKTGEVVTVVGKGNTPLRVSLSYCSKPWQSDGGNSYTCPTSSINLYNNESVETLGTSTSSVALTPEMMTNERGYLLVSTKVPDEAGKEYEGTSAALTIYVTATQRAGKTRP